MHGVALPFCGHSMCIWLRESFPAAIFAIGGITMSLIQVSNLTFCYEGSCDNIFENVSFQIDTDWRLGLTGRNGRGKTTLLRLLQGMYPHRGTIRASVGFDYFPYTVPDPEECPLELLPAICPEVPQWCFLRELAPLEVPEEALYRPFSTLSGGERSRILLAMLFSRDNRFLLIDEPTNHLDRAGRELVSRYLRSKRGFLLVSHDRAFLDGCVDHILSINPSGIELQRGNFSSWYENKQRRKNLERRQQNAIEEKSALLKNLETNQPLKLHPLTHHARQLALLRDLTICYGSAPVCSGVCFQVEQGERIALCGPNGSGKSSILKLLCGQDIPHTGTLELASGLVISYVPQDASGLRGSLRDYAARCGIDETLFKTILRKLGFERVQFEKDMSDYSAGQKKKVLLARSMCQSAHLYIWDEPLNYVDVLSRIQIEELLTAFRPTLLFVEHDRMFCDKIATKLVEL